MYTTRKTFAEKIPFFDPLRDQNELRDIHRAQVCRDEEDFPLEFKG